MKQSVIWEGEWCRGRGGGSSILAFKPTGWTHSERLTSLADTKPSRSGVSTIYGELWMRQSVIWEGGWCGGSILAFKLTGWTHSETLTSLSDTKPRSGVSTIYGELWMKQSVIWEGGWCWGNILAFKPTGWTHSERLTSLSDTKPKSGVSTIYGVYWWKKSIIWEGGWCVCVGEGGSILAFKPTKWTHWKRLTSLSETKPYRSGVSMDEWSNLQSGRGEWWGTPYWLSNPQARLTVRDSPVCQIPSLPRIESSLHM